jgi:hypothetical protein
MSGDFFKLKHRASMHRVWKHILIITPLSLFVAIMGFFIFYPVPKPPAGEMEYARNAISGAVKKGAGTYSQTLYNYAVNCYDSALILWKLENTRNRYRRNYNEVSRYASMAAAKALEASRDSEANTTGLNASVLEKINSVIKTDEEIKRRFSKYPLPTEFRHNISRGQILLSEARIAWEEGDYVKAQRKIEEAESLLVAAYEYADTDLRNYFRAYPKWKTWIDTTINESRINQDYSIIVDKYSRKLVLYYNGEPLISYKAELGKNWVGDKRVRGDKATPEGMYRITKKFLHDSTTYHKALLLDYPNEEDTAIFEGMIAKGQLPKNAKIGGMIEIHGNGGKGSDWTAGCIALTDREMDSLFSKVKIGTRVTIVGSMYSLNNVLKR